MALKLLKENTLVKAYFIKDPLAQYLSLGQKNRFAGDNGSQKYTPCLSYIRFSFRELC